MYTSVTFVQSSQLTGDSPLAATLSSPDRLLLASPSPPLSVCSRTGSDMEDGGSSPLRCQIDFHFTQTLLSTAGRPSPSNFHKQTLVYLFTDYSLPLSHLLLCKQIEHNGKKRREGEGRKKKQPQTTVTQLSLKTGTDFY